MQSSNTYTSSNLNTAPIVQQVMLPTQIIEKPVAVHEEIRKETIEEVQPVFNVEKLKTEIHQVTQPLFDKEVRPVSISSQTMATEVLPEILVQGRGARAVDDISTTRYLDTATVVVEKPAMYTEIEKKQIIEEIQPVIYKETVVPTVIQETKPIYQKIVEGPVYTQQTLASRQVDVASNIAPGYVPDNTIVAPTTAQVMLPTQIVEKPVAIHEEIRRETIEEIQPVVNVEKLKTEVHQVTQPLFDKEVRPVMIERRVLAQEILPEQFVQGSGARAVADMSTTQYLDTQAVLIEKPAIYNEIERTQIIEEIQPVVYKETIVPTVIRETKPVYQKIVEGPVYTQQTLPARSLNGSGFQYPLGAELPRETIVQPQIMPQQMNQMPLQQQMPINLSGRDLSQNIPISQTALPVVQPIVQPVVPLVQEHHRKEILNETTTTTTTTTVAPVVGGTAHQSHSRGHNNVDQTTTNGKQHHGLGGLFHRHGNQNTATTGTTGTTNYGTTGLNSGSTFNNTTTPLGNGMTQHIHNERVGAHNERIIEDKTVTSSHSERVVPTRAL